MLSRSLKRLLTSSLRSRQSRCRSFCPCLIEWASRTIFDSHYDRFLNAQKILKSDRALDCWWCFEYFNILLLILLFCRLNVASMRVKILEYKYFIADVIISSLLYFMSTRQFHDFTEAVDACWNSCRLATKTFVLLKNLNHSERSDEGDDVAKSIKKTSFAFFKSLIVDVSHFFKKQFQLIYHDVEIVCEVS